MCVNHEHIHYGSPVQISVNAAKKESTFITQCFKLLPGMTNVLIV